MRCKITGLALTLLLSGAAGCIREDLSGCRPGVGVVYEYSLNSEQENLFGSEVDKVTTYAFDENGIFVGSYSDAGEHLTNDYRMVLPLPDGPDLWVTTSWGTTPRPISPHRRPV